MTSSASTPRQSRRSYCRFTSGEPATPVDGTAAIGLEGVEIDLKGRPRRIWQYAMLRSSEPLRANAIDVLLSSSTEPGAKLFVQGGDFAAALRQHAPHLTASADRRRTARTWLIVLALVVALLAIVVASGWHPLKYAATTLPENWRQRLGDVAREQMTSGHKQCVDAAGVAALQHLTKRLATSGTISTPFDVRVYDWDLANAFAVPGGKIILTRGLIDEAESADEVAGVLAHEMGHGIELDPETGIIRSIGLAATLEIVLGGSGGALANAGLVLAQLGYSRGAERQADHHALELLKAASIAPDGFGNFFNRAMKSEGHRPSAAAAAGPLSWLQTHPPVAERAELVKEQPRYPATPALTPQDWRALQSICKTTIEPKAPDDSEPKDQPKL
jgi:Zn-dependent protease with chaperone function